MTKIILCYSNNKKKAELAGRLFLLLIATLKFSLILLFLGCDNTYIDRIDRGDTYNYQPGFPELWLSSTAYINIEDAPIVNITGNLVKGSLIYVSKNDTSIARFNVEISITMDSDNKAHVIRDTFSDSIKSVADAFINSQEIYVFEKEYEVDPGDLIIEVVVSDDISSKETVRRTTVTVPSPDTKTSAITNVSLLTKNSDNKEDEFDQATTFDIPSRMDSLRFRFQAINRDEENGLNVEMQLLRFESDTSVARPMHFNNYSPSSIQYSGIEYDDYEVVQSSLRNLSQIGNVVIEYNFHELDRGNYRLQVSSGEGDDRIYKAIEFSIKSPYYPSLRTPEELARPLQYVMPKDEYEQLMSISDPDKLKQAIDRFWLSNIQNSVVARNVISLYYERVEEANKLFSNYKEGWKTDTGMMYILFGPPMYIDTSINQMLWSYSYNREDPERNFLFIRPKLNSKFYPFDNYVLRRNNDYYNLQYAQIMRWVNGSILKYPL